MSNLPANLMENKTEMVIMQGDLAKLTPDERLAYVNHLCESLGLNPLTRPFDYIPFNGKLVLYVRKDGTDQLRKIHGVSVTDLKKEIIGDLFHVTAYGKDRSGKTDVATGALNVAGLKGEALANALMKCETKAKRRLTLSICGLGFLDETEVDEPSSKESIQEPASKFEDSQRDKDIKEMIIKFKKIGVSESQIRDSIDLGPDQLITEMTNEQADWLVEVGTKIKNKKAKAEDFFKVEE